MTELEAKAKDCIENHTHKLVDKPTKQDIYLREESIFISGYKLGATEATTDLEKQITELKLNCDLILEGKDNEIDELKEQIIDLKDFVFKVSKFLHNNNNVRPDNLVYKERDVLLIKELKLFEKWESKEIKEK